MFAAAVQRKAQEDRLTKRKAKKPYSRPNPAVKLVFKPSPLKATIKSAAAFDAFRQTRDVKALFTHLYHIILAAHFVSPSCFDPEFIGSQIVALIMAEYARMNAQGLLIVGNASVEVKRTNYWLKKLPYNVSHCFLPNLYHSTRQEMATDLHLNERTGAIWHGRMDGAPCPKFCCLQCKNSLPVTGYRAGFSRVAT